MKSNTPLKKGHVSNKPWLVSVLFPYYFPVSAASWPRNHALVWCQDHAAFCLGSAASGVLRQAQVTETTQEKDPAAVAAPVTECFLFTNRAPSVPGCIWGLSEDLLPRNPNLSLSG